MDEKADDEQRDDVIKPMWVMAVVLLSFLAFPGFALLAILHYLF